jgi:putative protease
MPNQEEGKLIGKISHYFSKIGVAIIDLSDSLKLGDTIRVVGGGADFTQVVESMQIEHQNIEEAKSGDSIGIKISQKVKEEHKVYKV